jgi:serine/threonine protein kinase
LKREIKIHKKIEHPHIVKLYYYFEDAENVYLVMDYAENGSLFHYLRKRKKIPEEEAFIYFF